MTIKQLFLLVPVLAICLTSCNKEDEMMPGPEPSYTVPSTYSFENVDYSGQTTRLAMLNELKAYMASANEAGVSLDADRLKGMYSNDKELADWSQEYDPSKQLKSKTFTIEQDVFDLLMEELAAISTSTETASEGVAGRATSIDGSKTYLLNDKGIETLQLIEKGLMGACFYYQSVAVYFGEDRMDVDNVTVEPGKGTAMEHHWDEAFGYFGVPVDFPSNTDGLFFWGNYCNGRDAVLGTNKAIMDAFLAGRAAISNDDLTTRDEAIATVREQWELVSASTALHYLNSGAENFDDLARKAHALSEAIAFIYSIQFNPAKRIDNARVNDLLNTLARSSDFSEMSLYDTTLEDILTVRDELAADFGLEAEKEQF